MRSLVGTAWGGVIIILLAACGNSDSVVHLVAISDAGPSEACPFGGLRLDTGVDENANGILDSGEVGQTSYICHGRLVTVRDEPAGSNCSAGGKRIDSGTDDDGDGALDTDEIEQTSYICGTAPCTVTDDGNGTKTIACPDGTQVEVLDGVDSLDEVYVISNALRLSYGPAVLDVWCYVDGLLAAKGTGTKTTTGTVITAFHVIYDCDALDFWSGVIYAGGGGVVSRFGATDAVEIQSVNWTASGRSVQGVPPHFNVQPSLGEIVYALSYPGSDLRNDVQTTVGYVTDENVELSLDPSVRWFWQHAFTADYVASAGSSGAPVFNRAGEWFAIHVGGYNSGLDLDYALPLQP